MTTSTSRFRHGLRRRFVALLAAGVALTATAAVAFCRQGGSFVSHRERRQARPRLQVISLGCRAAIASELFPSSTPLSEDDIRTAEERQLVSRNGKKLGWDLKSNAMAAGRRCRHGWPQALIFDPIQSSGRLFDTVRLSCPLLVAAIDGYEKSGAIVEYNKRLARDEAWQKELLKVNLAQIDIRRRLVAGREDQIAKTKNCRSDADLDVILGRGLAQMRQDSSDVKCLHAQVADQLTRTGNMIGQQVLDDLEDHGAAVMGCETCRDCCDVEIPVQSSRWNFDSEKQAFHKKMRIASNVHSDGEKPEN
eukprot:TRINITY_DN51244_c0_g1_i1.p1 TRINITY_DN51244_c0_g1~~TRINITY_DN51244_c0_g1_i1.p1  ORF type:complete len:307 (+),score=41.08 TRINITY_DN51244_c0_g1_i1:2-922(+)